MTAFERHTTEARERLRTAGVTRSGPGSVSWKINREIIVIAAWGRAILLQLAHPAVGAAVHHHSAFRGSLFSGLRRLHSTVRAMLSITFGDTEQMIATAAGISTIHDHVRGRVASSRASSRHDGAGDAYSAHDPELQRWVHATLLESIPLTYELLVGPLTVRERDLYCSEATIMEPLLGMPAGWLPRHSTQLDTYMREMLASGRLVVNDTSRTLARAVLYPPRWRLLWPMFRPLQLITIGQLPAAVRDAYGFEWSQHDARALARWTTALRLVRRLMPASFREWPSARTHSNVKAIVSAAPAQKTPVEVLCDTK